jgi:hypothetical protein
MPARSGRWRHLLTLAALALAAFPVAAVRGDDLPAPGVEGPWVVGADADTAIIVDDRGNVIMTGGALERSRRCESETGCAAFWDDAIGAAVIIVPADNAGAIDSAVEDAERGQPPP